MLSLLKKSNTKSDDGRTLAWHPNFRNAEQLPDTKTVRTKFFVNAVAASAVTALLLFVALRELRLASLKSDLAEVEAQIVSTTKPSDKAVADFKLFQEQEKRFNEAHVLVKDSFRLPDFLIHLGSLLSPGVKIDRVDFQGIGKPLNVAGSVKGVDVVANGVASEFVKKLQADSELVNSFSTIVLDDISRKEAEGIMSFRIIFTFKGGAKK